MRVLLKQVIVVCSASIAYYLLADVLMERLPWSSIPTWTAAWLSKATATLIWFQLLTVGGALLAAAPIAVALALTIGAPRIRLALVIGGMTAVATLVPLVWAPITRSSHSAPAWMILLSSTTLVGAIFLSVPLLVWVLSVSLPSNFRWGRRSIPGGAG
jgi:hypothetical protein